MEVDRDMNTGRSSTSEGGGGNFSALLGDLQSGRLVFANGVSRLALRADVGMDDLYRARFEGPVPEVEAEGGTVTFRYPRRPWFLDWGGYAGEVTLNAAVPWRIEVRGGVLEVTAELGSLDLSGLEVKGGASKVHLELPEPSGAVPVRITGGASEVTVRRPSGVAARLRLEGGAAGLTFDEEIFGAVGGEVRLQSSGYEDAPRRYDIEISGGTSEVTLAPGPRAPPCKREESRMV